MDGSKPETQAVIRPIVTGTYGDGPYVEQFVPLLARKVDDWPNGEGPQYGAESREDMIRLTCWDWFSGGSTAASVARKIEAALGGSHA